MKIFHDGFEINATTAWDGTTTASGGSVGTSATNPNTGTYHLRSTTTGAAASTGYAQRTMSTGGGLSSPRILTLDGGLTQDFIPASAPGVCHVSFCFSVSRAPNTTLENHNIFYAMHSGGSTATDITTYIQLSGGTGTGLWSVKLGGTLGAITLPSFNPTAGTYYRCYVRIERPHMTGTTGGATSYHSTAWIFASAPGSTTVLTRGSFLGLDDALLAESLRYLQFGRMGGSIFGAGPGSISIDIDDVSVNDEQDPNSTGLHMGDPGNPQTKTFDDPTADGASSGWNTTGANHFGEVQKGSGDAKYVDTDQGASTPIDQYTRTAFNATNPVSGTDVPTSLSMLLKGGPDAGSLPAFHSFGIIDGSSNKHYRDVSPTASGLAWDMVVAGEQYGGGALTKTYLDNSEFIAEKRSNFANLNDFKLTEFFGWTEDDNATSAVDYSGESFEKDQTQGSIT